MVPETQYVRTAGVSVAYQVIGDGPVDLVLVPGFLSNIEVFWEQPRVARFLHKLASFSRLIIFDKRGTGLSDRVTDAATLEERMDDVRAVMDKIGSERAALFGYSEGGSMCALFAATYPERTVALIMAGSFARRTFTDDYPCAPTEQQMLKSIEEMLAHWGEPFRLDLRAPSVAQDPAVRQWYAKYLRMSASPAAAGALAIANLEIDIRYLLPAIRTPTLILHASGDRVISPDAGKYLAANIPGARFAEIRSSDHVPFFEGAEECLGQIQKFLTGTTPLPEFDSRLCTIMFTDIVGSTDRAIEIGDRRYQDLLESHHARVRSELQLYRGQEIRTTGDGFVVSFDGPARAIQCGLAITSAVREIGLDVRVGLHTGECEVRSGELSGIALNIAARVAALAAPARVLVSQTVRDLVAGSGLKFADGGVHTLKGLPEEWRLFEVSR
jgi:pimeloyl-ACP methyl ester carboxylesterase/class 3 adenylate cyclase